MRLLEKTNGILEYVADIDETSENQAFLKKIADYKIQRQGSGIYFFDKRDNKPILYCNPFDNTLFVIDQCGYALAAEFGAKRFLVGKARSTLTTEAASEQKAIQFDRDLSFPLKVAEEEKATTFKAVTLAELLAINKENPDKLYENLAELFNRCADFTPGKQDEYLTGGKKADKFCRFNLDSQKPLASTVTDQIFLLDKQNKVIGTISATVMVQPDGTTDVYFYDEIVDYFTRLQPTEKEALEKLYKNEEKLSEEAQKAEIAKIIEPRRLELMRPLFAAAREKVIQTISTVSGLSGQDLIEAGKVHAFIRAAAGRVPSYKALACGEEKSATHVIHGPATNYTKMLDSHVKIWADQQLLKLSTAKKSSSWSYGKVFTFGAAAAVLGLLAYRACRGGTGSAQSFTATPNTLPGMGMIKK